MLKIIFFLICLSLSLSLSSSSSSITCKYENQSYYKFGTLYHCNSIGSLFITSQETALVGSVSGTHLISKSNDDVVGFYLYGHTVELFPRGLEVFFKNIKAITLGSCKIKEIYQADLKPFTKLTYLYMPTSEIEVLEEGLFAFNPDLEVLGVEGSMVIHIDPNVFDHLTKLNHFWFQQVPCAATQYIYGSKVQIDEAIQKIKTRCVDSEYKGLDERVKVLESEAASLNAEDFKVKLESFEKGFKDSKFSKFRPLKGKFEALKSKKFDNSVSVTTAASTTAKPSSNQDSNLDKCQSNPNSLSSLISELKSITIDLKSSQCGLKDDLAGIKVSQTSTAASISDITSKISNIASQLLESQKSSPQLTQNDLKVSQDAIKSTITDSLNNLTKNLKSSQDDARLLQYEIKGSVSDMESSLSGLKSFQNEVKVALIKLKTTQNEMEVDVDEIRAGNGGNSGEKPENFENLEGKLNNIEGQLGIVKAEMNNKFHKMSVNFDEKIKGIETRIVKKIEELLEAKLKNLK